MSRDGRASPSGLLLVDKPPGLTSHDVVAWVRRELGVRRIGHAGTLDPFASGLLPCCVGRATRLVRFLQQWSKSYTGLIALGEETPTGDVETATGRPPAPLPPPTTIEAARRRLSGTYLQTPPAFSAKKVGGTPAHRLARRGATPTLAPVRITVHSLRLERRTPGCLAFAARVSTGTYLRTLARDVGRICGTGAHLAALRRTRIGPLSVRQAVVPQSDGVGPEGMEGVLIPAEAVPLPLPEVPLTDADARRFLHGQPVAVPDGPPERGPARVLDPAGRLLGIGEAGEPGWLRPLVVLLDP
jgi:tRNA pseudouridine55 synthase